jgi:hypothetical protein
MNSISAPVTLADPRCDRAGYAGAMAPGKGEVHGAGLAMGFPSDQDLQATA